PGVASSESETCVALPARDERRVLGRASERQRGRDRPPGATPPQRRRLPDLPELVLLVARALRCLCGAPQSLRANRRRRRDLPDLLPSQVCEAGKRCGGVRGDATVP